VHPTIVIRDSEYCLVMHIIVGKIERVMLRPPQAEKNISCVPAFLQPNHSLQRGFDSLLPQQLALRVCGFRGRKYGRLVSEREPVLPFHLVDVALLHRPPGHCTQAHVRWLCSNGQF
jgi:hypothetical protein